jgi:multidrug efflux system membrane fusion protein
LLVLMALSIAGCGDSSPKRRAAPPPPRVTVAQPIERTIVDRDEYVGRFIAVDSVEIRARVSGYLEKVHFKDGQIVKHGDLLFSIDKRPFQNAHDQARGNLAQAKANLAFATADLARAEKLVREKTISEQVFDQRVQAKRTAAAIVAAREAAVRLTSLELEFTELRAPITGRIGDRRVSPGNLVTGGNQGNTLLATIVSIDPIRFEFTFDEASFLRYERLSRDGKDVASRGAGVEVALKLIDEDKFIHKGRMDFIDNVIDRSSGTIRGRAQFGNPNDVFTPGMFARIRVPASPPHKALLVPDTALGTEQVRKFVLVVDKDNVARTKYVTLGSLVGKLRVINSGLVPDDRVIVNGLMRLRAGQKVNPQKSGAAPARKRGPPAGKSAQRAGGSGK